MTEIFLKLDKECMPIIKAMQKYLLKENNNESNVLLQDGTNMTIDGNINVGELRRIDEELERQKNQQKRDAQSDRFRSDALSQNKYSPDNPYFYK